MVHLLSSGKSGGLTPRNIVAFTFTDKAAAELKERIITRWREALGEVTGLAEMFIGTIHVKDTGSRDSATACISFLDFEDMELHPAKWSAKRNFRLHISSPCIGVVAA